MNYKNFILYAFLCLSFTNINAQSLYQINFTSFSNPQNSKASAFLIRNLDMTGFVRVNYFDSVNNIHTIVNWDIKEELIDSNTIIIKLSNPEIIGKPAIQNFKPDYFIFKKTAASEYFEPYKVAISSANNNLQMWDFSNPPHTMKENELDYTFIKNYFVKDEPFYKRALSSGRGSSPLLAANNAILYLIIVTDVEDPHIGKDCQKDIENLKYIYTNISIKLQIPLKPYTLTGSSCSREAVNQMLDNLHPANNDIVILHYTGHGFHAPERKDTFPTMYLVPDKTAHFDDITPYTLSISEVFKKIVSKGARLNLVISDCCNDDFPDVLEKTKAKANGRDGVNFDQAYCSSLFLNQRLSALVSSTRVGERSKSNSFNGAIYTSNYIQMLNKLLSPLFNTKGTVSWNMVFENAKQGTDEFLQPYVAQFGKKYQMTPVVKMDK